MARIEGGIISDSFDPRGQILFIGTNNGIPDWMIDKLNRMLALSKFHVNGVRYSRNDAVRLKLMENDNSNTYSSWSIGLFRV
jgi:hypothetical protein